MDTPTNVYITIDTEFGIAGHITFPNRYQPVGARAVLCPSGAREHGLGFILEHLAEHGITATFFVETLNHVHFGESPMRGIVDRLLEAGQDAQLHVHPEWLRLLPPPEAKHFAANGSCDGRSADELREVFDLAVAAFERWTSYRPDAIRTGGLRADLQVYRSIRELGIPLSSSLGLGAFLPQEAELRRYNGRHVIEGVVEIPVFTYRDIVLPTYSRQKSLQITSCGGLEMERVLRDARAQGARTIVVLTHPAEFAKHRGVQYTKFTRNRVNQSRFERLLRFITGNSRDFVARSFRQSRDEWLSSPYEPEVSVTIPTYYAVGRMLHNKLNDSLWHY